MSDAPASAPDPKEHDEWRFLHLWEIQPVRDILIVLGVLALLWLGDVLSIVTVPILLALALAYLFEPVVRRVTRVRWISREGAAVGIIAAIVLAVMIPLTIGLGVAIVQGVDFATRFATNLSELQASIQEPENEQLYLDLPNDGWRNTRDFFVEELDDIEGADAFSNTLDRVSEWISANAQVIGERALNTGVGAVSAVLAFFTSLSLFGFGAFLTLFFFFFFSTGYARVLSFGERLLPERNKPTIVRLLKEMDRVIAAFIRGRVVIAVIQSVLFTAGYLAAGVPAAFILGPFTGFVSIIPYAALVSLPIAVILLAVEPNTGWQDTWWWTLLGPAVVYFPLQALDDYVWTPLIQGKETNMETPTILFASIAGGVLAGPYGLLLGIPAAACVKILLNELVWPRVEKWTRGEAEDPLPISRD
jgi:predicted PurR-regulated permease PerM